MSKITAFLALIFANSYTTLEESMPFTPETPDEQAILPYYREKISPLLQAYEENRIKALRLTRGLTWGIAALYLIIGYYYFHSPLVLQKGLGFFWSMALPFAIVSCVIISLPGKLYIGDMKRKIYPLILQFFGKDFTYNTTAPHRISDFSISGILPPYTHERIFDYIRGSYKNVAIEVTSALLTRRERVGKNEVTIKVFNGLFIRFDITKRFNQRTIIKRDRTGLQTWIDPRHGKFERIKLEDPKFEEMFDVYGTSQIESRYLLTTSFMDRLLRVADAHQGGGMQASFYDAHLLMSLPLKRPWLDGSSLYTPATFTRDIKVILSDMRSLFALIDELQLDDSTRL